MIFSSNLKEALISAKTLLEEKSIIKKQKDWLLLMTTSGLSKIQGPQPTLKWAACTPRLV